MVAATIFGTRVINAVVFKHIKCGLNTVVVISRHMAVTVSKLCEYMKNNVQVSACSYICDL